MGIRQAGLPLGGAVAAAILPGLAAAWSWRAAFVAGAAAALGGGLAFALIYRPPPDLTDAGSKRAALTFASVVALLRQSWMRNAMVAGLALVSAQYGILTWLMLDLRDHAHIPLTHGAFYLALAQAAGVAGRIGLAAWSDRTPGARFRLLTASMIAVAAGVLLLAFVPPQTPEPALAVLAAWLGFFGLGWYGPWVAYLAETAPADQVGLTLGAAMAINQLGIIGAPPLLGLVHDLSGGYTALWACVVAGLAIAYGLTVRMRRAGPFLCCIRCTPALHGPRHPSKFRCDQQGVIMIIVVMSASKTMSNFCKQAMSMRSAAITARLTATN